MVQASPFFAWPRVVLLTYLVHWFDGQVCSQGTTFIQHGIGVYQPASRNQLCRVTLSKGTGQGGPSRQFPSAFGPSHHEGRGSASVQAQIQGAPRGLQRLHGGWGREVGSGERRRSARTHGPSPRPAWHLQPPPRFSWRRARRPQRAPRLYLGARQLAAPACLPCRDTQVTRPQEPIGSRGLGP